MLEVNRCTVLLSALQHGFQLLHRVSIPSQSPHSAKLTISKSAKASSGDCLGLGFLATRPSAHALISGITPLLSSLNSVISSFPSLVTVAFPIVAETVPCSHATASSSPVKVVPKETEKLPLTPDLVFHVASRVSAGGRCSCNKAEYALSRTGVLAEGSKSRVPATKCTPPSSRNPPW